MHSKWVFNHFSIRPKHHKRLLVSLWIVGLLSGMLLCAVGADRYSDIFLTAIVSRPAPLSLVLVSAIPVVLIIFSLITPLYAISYLTVFLFAFLHGFSGFLPAVCNIGGAWLLRPMFLFSASLTSVLMWWLLLSSRNQARLRTDILLISILLCVVFLVDLFVVSPFLGDLSKYF